MPPLSIIRLLFSLLSIIVLAAALYFLWSWYQGDYIRNADGGLSRVHDARALWTGIAFATVSLFGGRFIPLLIAGADTERTRAVRSNGRTIAGTHGGDLYVEISGDAGGPVVVLTHGWGLDSTIWQYAKRDLEKSHKVIVWDLPGLGKSKLKGQFTLERAAADLQTVIGLAEGKPVILVGHSIGGMIIQTLASEAPRFFQSEVASVVLLNTTPVNPINTALLSGVWRPLQKPVLEPLMHLMIWISPLLWLSQWQSYFSGGAHLANRFQFGRHVTRSQLEHVTLLAARASPATIAKGDLAMCHWRGLQPGAIQKAVLVIGGDKDIVTKVEASRTLANATEGDILIVADANHMGFLEQHHIYQHALENFAARHQPTLETAPYEAIALPTVR